MDSPKNPAFLLSFLFDKIFIAYGREEKKRVGWIMSLWPLCLCLCRICAYVVGVVLLVVGQFDNAVRALERNGEKKRGKTRKRNLTMTIWLKERKRVLFVCLFVFDGGGRPEIVRYTGPSTASPLNGAFMPSRMGHVWSTQPPRCTRHLSGPEEIQWMPQ